MGFVVCYWEDGVLWGVVVDMVLGLGCFFVEVFDEFWWMVLCGFVLLLLFVELVLIGFGFCCWIFGDIVGFVVMVKGGYNVENYNYNDFGLIFVVVDGVFFFVDFG